MGGDGPVENVVRLVCNLFFYRFTAKRSAKDQIPDMPECSSYSSESSILDRFKLIPVGVLKSAPLHPILGWHK